MLTRKLILSQLKKYLARKAQDKDPDTESYLDFLNTGIYVDLNRFKKPLFKLLDRFLSQLERNTTYRK
jgi:peptide methionine sulfoxide reductase MsrB